MRQFTGGALPVLVFFWAMLLTGCGKVGLPFSGRVVDVETGKPIEGAFVLALWKGEVGLFDAQLICYRVETAVTDEDGRFRIPGWIGGGYFGVMNSYISTIIYKSDYIDSDKSEGDIQYLKRFRGAREDRLRFLISRASHSCFSAQFQQLTPYNDALYEEAKTIAITSSEKNLADRVKYYLDVVKYGWDKADQGKQDLELR